jgi:hypothetical protein
LIAILAEAIQGFRDTAHAESDMIDHPPLGRLKALAILPKLRHGVAGVFNRIDDNVDVVHRQRSNGFHMHSPVDAARARPDVARQAEVLLIPLAGGNRIFTQQVDMWPKR